jgi:hypothetical protein
MKTAQVIKKENGELTIEGQFKFDSANITHINEYNQPIFKIFFDWCPEAPDGDYNKMYEMMAEKLKQDFLEYCGTYKK